MAVCPTPCPARFHTPPQAFPDRLALDAPVPLACFGPIGGNPSTANGPVPPAHWLRLGSLLNAISAVFSG
jgi:hypothetical protein